MSLPTFTTLGDMTDADNVMNPQDFGSDLVDTWNPGSESGLIRKSGFESRITFG